VSPWGKPEGRTRSKKNKASDNTSSGVAELEGSEVSDGAQLKKGPFVDDHLIEKIEALNSETTSG
jgi:hypothetical protein